MKRKVLAVALAVAMLAASLTGCGDSAATSGSQAASGKDTVAASGTESGSKESTGVSLDSLPESIELGVTVTATPEMYANTDLSKSYTVNMYLIGDTPNDWDKVLGLINDYLKPFNTDLAVTFMSWSDYQTMYSLTLTGSDVDLIFTSLCVFMWTGG